MGFERCCSPRTNARHSVATKANDATRNISPASNLPDAGGCLAEPLKNRVRLPSRSLRGRCCAATAWFFGGSSTASRFRFRGTSWARFIAASKLADLFAAVTSFRESVASSLLCPKRLDASEPFAKRHLVENSPPSAGQIRSEEDTSELQSQSNVL